MADKSLVERFGIKPGQKLLILNAPDGAIDLLRPLPDGVTLTTEAEGKHDFVIAFVDDKAAIDMLAPKAAGVLKPSGHLWFSYPKQSGNIKTDINRDAGWEAVHKLGLEGVRQISVDTTWSALRFRPSSEIKRKGR